MSRVLPKRFSGFQQRNWLEVSMVIREGQHHSTSKERLRLDLPAGKCAKLLP